MTRETKIGLLVGLAFLIVIGLLLTDHMTSTAQPPPAQLAQVAHNVRDSAAVPGGAAPAVIVTPIPANVGPTQQVPTPADLNNTPPSTPIVTINGPTNSQPPVVIEHHNTPDQVNTIPSAEMSAGADAPVRTTMPNGRLMELATQHGEPIVPVGNRSADRTAAGVEYLAEPNDSVSKMAAKFMGGNTKANRDAIVAANASLKADPNKVIVGKTYIIPTNSAPILASTPAPTTPATPVIAAAAGESNYTVKPGDSLWKIASTQLGSGSAVSTIMDLNKDVLKGGDLVHPGMTLRLPAKPASVASTN